MNKDDAEREAECSITLRLPVDLHKALCELARAENRSLNSKIVSLLEQVQKPPADADAYRGSRTTLGAMPRYTLPRPFGRRPRGGG